MNQNGSMTILAVGLSAAILLLTFAIGQGLNSSQNLITKSSYQNAKSSVLEKLNAIYGLEQDCRDYLMTGDFATAATGLIAASNPAAQSDELLLRLPNSTEPLLAANTRLGPSVVSSVVLTEMSAITDSPRSYQAKIFVKVQAAQGIDSEFKIPIYFVTDGSGTLNYCMISYLDNSGKSATDTICQMLKGISYFYDPEERRCKSS